MAMQNHFNIAMDDRTLSGGDRREMILKAC